MRPLFYIMRKSFKNHIKELKHKPGTLILYLVIIALLAAMILISIFSPNKISLSQNKKELYSAIISGIVMIVIIYGLHQGASKGNSFFRLADVNLVFTSPISPQKVLIYGFIKQLYTSFLIIFFLIFQLPNLKFHFPLTDFGGLIILLTAFFLVFSMSIIGLLTYSIASRYTKARGYIDKVIYVIIGLLLLGFVLTYFKVRDPKQAALTFLNHKLFLYIPFIGWFKQIFMSAILGINTAFFIHIVLVVVFLIILMYIMYKLNTDYYEDVLAATESKEEQIKNKKEGKSSFNFNSKKVRKIQNTNMGTGAKAIFYRHMLEYRKSGIPFIDKTTLSVVIAGTFFGYFTSGKNINTVLYFSIYMLFFFVIQGKWSQELSKPYIYLLPFSSAKKVFFATLGDLIKYTIDGFILFTTAGILMKSNIMTIIFCSITYASFAAIYIYGDMLARKLLGSTHSKNVEMFLKLFLIFFIILPEIVISIALSIISPFASPIINEFISYIVLLTYNIIVSFILLICSKGIFEKLEMK